jgi:hypothetical protein
VAGIAAVEVGPATYLDSDTVRVLDVLLVRPSSVHSRAIAHATDGPFSHALIVLNPGYGLQSTKRVGVDFFHLDSRLYRVNSQPRFLTRLRSFDWEYVSLRRHPQFVPPKPEPEAFNFYPHPETLSDLISSYLAANYTHVNRLVNALPARPSLIFRKITELLRSRSRHSAGVFCSELVALCFEAVGLHATDKTPESTSPNDLARGGVTNLEIVHEAFLEIPDTEIAARESAPDVYASQLLEATSHLRRRRREMAKIDKEMADLATMVAAVLPDSKTPTR